MSGRVRVFIYENIFPWAEIFRLSRNVGDW
jgi:hypothetical protein